MRQGEFGAHVRMEDVDSVDGVDPVDRSYGRH